MHRPTFDITPIMHILYGIRVRVSLSLLFTLIRAPGILIMCLWQCMPLYYPGLDKIHPNPDMVTYIYSGARRYTAYILYYSV